MWWRIGRRDGGLTLATSLQVPYALELCLQILLSIKPEDLLYRTKSSLIWYGQGTSIYYSKKRWGTVYLMKLSYIPLELELTTECKIFYFRLQILYCLTNYISFYLYKRPWSHVPVVTCKIPEFNYTLFEKYYLVANFNFSFHEQALHPYVKK